MANPTNVTGTATDSQTTPYISGTWTCNLFNPTSFQPIWSGTTNFTTSYGGSLDSTGSLAVALPSNTGAGAITVGGLFTTQWVFTICASDGASCFNATVTITGNSQSITASLVNASRITFKVGELNQPPCGVGQAVVSLGAGLSGCGAAGGGSSFPLTTSGLVNNGGSISVGAGTSGSIAGVQVASPPMGFYFSPNCPTGNTSNCFFTPSNTQQAVDCAWTSGSAVVTCNSAHFVASDAGKRAFGYQTCNAFAALMNNNANTGAIVNSGVTTPVTILTVNSPTQVTLSANASNSATVQTGQNGGGCFIWGTPDDTGAAALSAAVAAASACPKVFLANSYYMFTLPPGFMINQPAACNQSGGIFGGSAGNLFYAYGYELEGRGVGPTQIFLTPGFPESGPGCVNGPESDACFVRVLEGKWTDFSITGGQNAFGNCTTSSCNTKLIRVVGPGAIDKFTCMNWGAGTTNVRGLYISQWETLGSAGPVNNSGCGSIGIAIQTGAAVRAWNLSVENSPNVDVQVEGAGSGNGPALEMWASQIIGAQFTGAATGPNILNQGGWIRIHSSKVNPGGTTTAGLIGYKATVAGSLLTSEDTRWLFNTGNVAATNSAIVCTAACTNTFLNSTMVSQTGGFDIQDVANSKEIDLGGNTFTPRVSISGNVYGSASITGTQLVTGNVVLTSGWGTGAAGSAFSGSSTSQQWTTTIGTTPGTTAVTTVTFPVPFLVAPTCSATLAGGTSVALLQISCSATATAATVTYVGTLVSGTVITRLTASN